MIKLHFYYSEKAIKEILKPKKGRRWQKKATPEDLELRSFYKSKREYYKTEEFKREVEEKYLENKKKFIETVWRDYV